MIKIPGMREGWPAIERCLREGININITLLFSVEHYRAVSEAYLRALEARVRDGQPVDRLASVASFFVSRVDTEVDRRIEAAGGSLLALRGRVAIANARLAYAAFVETTQSSRWRRLAASGARVQRPLWASTGTKNPAYSDVLYVETLIGADTVTTVPPDTLRLFQEHGTVKPTLSDDPGDAPEVMEALATGGIDFGDVNRVLEEQGIEKFTVSFDKLLDVIREKRNTLAGASATEQSQRRRSTDLGRLGPSVENRLDAFTHDAVSRRIWARDPAVWKGDAATPELEGPPGLAHGRRDDGAAGGVPRGIRRRDPNGVRARRTLRNGGLEPGTRGAVAHLRAPRWLPGADRARQHGPAGCRHSGCRRRACYHALHRLQQIRDDAGNHEPSGITGRSPAGEAPSLWRLPIPGPRWRRLPRSEDSAAPSSTRLTSGDATRRSPPSASCRRH